MDVSARRELAGVEISVRIEPQHPQFPALFPTAARDGADRSDTERVIAAEQNRQPPPAQLGKHGVVNGSIPVHHLLQVAISLARGLPGVGRPTQVSDIEHLQTARLQSSLQSRHSQRFGAHRRAPIAGPDIGRRPDEARLSPEAHANTAAGRETPPEARGARSPNKSFGFSRSGTRSICCFEPRNS